MRIVTVPMDVVMAPDRAILKFIPKRKNKEQLRNFRETKEQ
jgi:hypothetical protein